MKKSLGALKKFLEWNRVSGVLLQGTQKKGQSKDLRQWLWTACSIKEKVKVKA